MRELRGVIIEETEATGTVAMPVDAARDVLRASIERFMREAIRFHEEAAEAQSNPAETQSNRIFNGPAEPDHSAIRITTGVGKSEATRAAAADYVCEARRASSWRTRWGRRHRSKCSRARTSHEPLAHASRPRASPCGSPVATGRPAQRC